MEKISNVDVEMAKSLVKTKVKKGDVDDYTDVYEYALKVLEKMYDGDINGTPLNVLSVGVIFHNITEYHKIEEIEESFGGDVAMLVFNISENPDDTNTMMGYDRIMKALDFLFVKLAIRMGKIHKAITDGDGDTFKSFISQYNEIRRKVLKNNPDILPMMDYEADLIKYGRNYFSGKAVTNYQYEHLIMDNA